eukprot:GHVP01056585.1.p1 GENE.GHVP01056585.1~~GHVP01056585.1.p1  ORF type:complete len:265 (+),score=46.95 GHVP01056585.1:344-1138(+)
MEMSEANVIFSIEESFGVYLIETLSKLKRYQNECFLKIENSEVSMHIFSKTDFNIKITFGKNPDHPTDLTISFFLNNFIEALDFTVEPTGVDSEESLKIGYKDSTLWFSSPEETDLINSAYIPMIKDSKDFIPIFEDENPVFRIPFEKKSFYNLLSTHETNRLEMFTIKTNSETGMITFGSLGAFGSVFDYVEIDRNVGFLNNPNVFFKYAAMGVYIIKGMSSFSKNTKVELLSNGVLNISVSFDKKLNSQSKAIVEIYPTIAL